MALQGKAALENVSTQPSGDEGRGWGGGKGAVHLVMEEQLNLLKSLSPFAQEAN